ncbi:MULTISPECIES: VUT family protein [Cysteiniphilum]|uniref:Uncharacterized protein n=1 Tax=Cysteiniphilum litorale TaxID=2056700 RepID=A0A8J2Z312_9GAMM|nr:MULTISPECIES: VUT family protein [Cysteiniphilum]GGF91288.1 hypothetical protein GCM10010995_05690 [Cysteiniphilum litorale]
MKFKENNLLKKDLHIASLALIMLYMSVKLTCNIIFFNHIEFNFMGFNFNMTYAAFLYPLVYVLMDRMVVCFGALWTVFIVLFGVLLDAASSGMIASTSFLPIPSNLSSSDLIHTTSIHNISLGVWSLFWHGLLGSIVAYLGELLLFNALYQKIFKKNFWLSSIASICTTMAIHNAICDYQMFADSVNRWHLIISNYSVNLVVIIIYTTILTFIGWDKQTLANKIKQ